MYFYCGVLEHFMVEYHQKRNNVVEVVHEEPTNQYRIQTLIISKQIKKQHIVKDKDGKTLEDGEQ